MSTIALQDVSDVRAYLETLGRRQAAFADGDGQHVVVYLDRDDDLGLVDPENHITFRFLDRVGHWFPLTPLTIAAEEPERMRQAQAVAWIEGHAAGRDYQGDGWNSDAHDPDLGNPYRAHEGHKIIEIPTFASSSIPRRCGTCEVELEPREDTDA